MEPKRLKNDLVKVLKSVKPEDRVLVVGTSRRPFDADLKPFCKVYRKIILIPRPDYASRLVLWRELLCGGGARLTPSLDLSSLAKVTDCYTQGHILQAVMQVLIPRRLAQQTTRPLKSSSLHWPDRTPSTKRKRRPLRCGTARHLWVRRGHGQPRPSRRRESRARTKTSRAVGRRQGKKRKARRKISKYQRQKIDVVNIGEVYR
ncbi:dynein regulatory complex protein 11 [Salmo salar]|uniref:Dynein regulatory complex protein 11 n=1 Tax=Salmo salar TaxID=8030 RepID=A0A1S3QC53_SALSA|nr:dynein regulatory complex protein 11-like [Salmo salar]|eukprot:XP_014036994.1 PREDICTED: IQ and AAA domain-containing protein 1-like [Salmo salar]